MAATGDEQRSDQPQRRGRGQRGTITSRPSRDTILQSYAAQDAERAERTRAHAYEAVREYQASSTRSADREAQRRALIERQREQEELAQRRRQEEVEGRQRAAQLAAAQQRAAMRAGDATPRAGRDMVSMRDTDEIYARAAALGRPGPASHPLSSEEGRERSRNAKEMHEFERASRDALSGSHYGRGGNREVIDARGSIDSRAFSEKDQLIGYSIEDEDKPEPVIDASLAQSQTRWHSRAGQGFDGVPDAGRGRVPAPLRGMHSNRPMGGMIEDSSVYGRKRNGMGLLPKVLIGVAVVALVVLLVIKFI